MADINPDFSLYHLTLKQQSGSVGSIIGNFSGLQKSQEVVIATQTSLQLWKFDKGTKAFKKALFQNAFANITNIAVYPTSSKDLILLVSDAGALTIVEYLANKNKFHTLKNEIFYKTGVRRTSPIEYIASDLRGRAVMLGAIERTKLVFTILQNGESNLVHVNSPIEMNRSDVLTFDMKAMDTGLENPIFATIETEYSSPTQKLLNYYEFDLGLNHVMLLESETIRHSSNHIIPVPGGVHGPSGIFLCSEGMIQYKCPFKPTHYVPIPTRAGNSNLRSFIVASVVHKMKNGFFCLAQNQFGDIFKIIIDFLSPQERSFDIMDERESGPGMVTSITVKYFDTIPVCKSLLILKSGFLLADCEAGDRHVYQFEKLGDGDDNEWNSQDYPDELSVMEEEVKNLVFETKSLENIVLVNSNTMLHPMVEMKLSDGDFINNLPELYSLTGSKANSAVKILHNSIQLSEIVTQDLPSKILGAFTTRIHNSDDYDKFIILSFFDGSIILRIGDEVEEAENSGFIDTITTLNIQQIGDSSIVQIHATGFKQVFYDTHDEPVKSLDWNPPPNVEVLSSSCTNTQVVLGLSNGDVVYFQTLEDNTLCENKVHKEFNSSIIGVVIGDIPQGKKFAPFIVVTCKDCTLHVLSTDPRHMLETTTVERLESVASSLLITTFCSRGSVDGTLTTFVHVGLRNGNYMRYSVLEDGTLVSMKKKFILHAPLRLFPVKVTNKNREVTTLTLINSKISFIVVPEDHGDIKLISLPMPEKFIEPEEEDENENDEVAEYAKIYGCIASLHSADVPQGLLLTHAGRLTIASMPELNVVDTSGEGCQDAVINTLRSMENIESINLRYTPRACIEHEKTKMTYIACTDTQIASSSNDRGDPGADEITLYHTEENDELLKFQQCGYPTSPDSSASCIHVFSSEKGAIGQTIELTNNEGAYRAGIATMERNGDIGDYLFVTTIANFRSPSDYKNTFVRVYQILEDGSLDFVYKQEFPKPVLAIHPFQGLVLFGFGDELGLYQLGKLQLLRKGGLKMDSYEIKDIVDIKSSGFRVFVSDIRTSVYVFTYDSTRNKFSLTFDDMIYRHVTRSVVLDHDTIMLGDKFGTITTLRNNDNPKLGLLSSFYIGDTITSLMKKQIGIGGEEVVVYGGINGTIGSLHTLKTVKEINFFKELEKLIRNTLDENGDFLIERDVLKFRSYYVPRRACIDGDLVELFLDMPDEMREKISSMMERPTALIDKRIVEMRSRVGY